MIYHKIAGSSRCCPEQSYLALILTNISEPSFEERSPDRINFVLCAVLINSYGKKVLRSAMLRPVLRFSGTQPQR
jgi:hypothetical protein